MLEPHFLTKVSIDNNEIIYEPTQSELKELIFESLGYITGTLEYLPQIEYKAYYEEFILKGEQSKDIRVSLEDGLVEKIKANLENVLDLCTSNIKDYFKKYEKYAYLSKSEIQDEIQAFFKEQHVFDDYAEARQNSIIPQGRFNWF